MLKICARCNQPKEEELFYLSAGKRRSECKNCTIRRNVRYQKKIQAWKNREPDKDARRIYMRKYYENNAQKFAKYRADFRLRHPEYYKEYFRKRKEK